MKALLLVALLGGALRADTPLPLMTTQLEALTPIDALPTTTALDAVFPDQTTAQRLAEIALATPSDGTFDFGVQLRAIRALPDYCPVGMPCGSDTAASDTLVHATLVQIISSFPSITAPTPQDILRLRAALESLGISGVSSALQSDEGLIESFLNNTSRDVRATTAKALGTLCVTQATIKLQQRFAAETSMQVQLAISAALRALKQGGSCGF